MKKSRPVSRAAYAIYTVKLDYDAVAAEVKRRRQIKKPAEFPQRVLPKPPAHGDRLTCGNYFAVVAGSTTPHLKHQMDCGFVATEWNETIDNAG